MQAIKQTAKQIAQKILAIQIHSAGLKFQQQKESNK